MAAPEEFARLQKMWSSTSPAQSPSTPSWSRTSSAQHAANAYNNDTEMTALLGPAATRHTPAHPIDGVDQGPTPLPGGYSALGAEALDEEQTNGNNFSSSNSVNTNDIKSNAGVSRLLRCILLVCLLVPFLFFVRSTLHPDRLIYERLRAPSSQGSFAALAGSHPEPPTPLWGKLLETGRPLPTGAFWTNLVLQNGNSPIGLYPYAVKTSALGVEVSHAAFRRHISEKTVVDPFVQDLRMGSAEKYVSHAVAAYDSMSVSMAFKTTPSPTPAPTPSPATTKKGEERHGETVQQTSESKSRSGHSGGYTAYLVKSTPFVTVEYRGVTPVLGTEMRIMAFEEARASISGKQYILTLGNEQKWLIYCSEPVHWTWDVDAATLSADSAIDGVVRVAVLPSTEDAADAAVFALQPYIQKYPTGASAVSITTPLLRQPALTGVVEWRYTSAGGDANSKLLMLALPHQLPILVSPAADRSAEAEALTAAYGSLWCVKGRLSPVIGDSWRLEYPLTDVGFNYVPHETLTKKQLSHVSLALHKDLEQIEARGIEYAADPYTFGKQLGRLAQLALIADYIGEKKARKQALAELERVVTPWVSGTNGNQLVYDRTYGGLVSSEGVSDRAKDYGNGWYNDHHFHYGYFIHAAAVLSQYGSALFKKHQAAFDSLAADVCTPSATDPYFPLARHKDFFDGHSWASGIYPQSDGKNQESSSEAANAYFACTLYGRSTGDSELAHFSQVLLAMEVHSTKAYWHMARDITSTFTTTTPITPTTPTTPTTPAEVAADAVAPVYDAIFAARRMVGNIGALDATTRTWFGEEYSLGGGLAYVHGIQVIPVTPLTALLFDRGYVLVQYPVIEPLLPPLDPTPIEGEEDDGDGDDDDGVGDGDGDDKKVTEPVHSVVATECSAHPKCASLGLTGDCCPVFVGGISLACCEGQPGEGEGGDKGGRDAAPVPVPKVYHGLTEEWQALLVACLAVADKDTAYERLLELSDMGVGNSRTNMLMWVMTREAGLPGFGKGSSGGGDGAGGGGGSDNNSSNDEGKGKDGEVDSASDPLSLCGANSPCAAAWMPALNTCCDMKNGPYLACCSPRLL